MRAVLLILALLVSTPAVAQSVSGAAHIVDGDTLVISETKIRLFGIDAPELDQNCTLEGQSWECGASSKDQLEGLTAGQTVSCRGTEADDHGRLLAICYAGGLELNATMVEYGWALAYRRYSNEYIAQEFRLGQPKKVCGAHSSICQSTIVPRNQKPLPVRTDDLLPRLLPKRVDVVAKAARLKVIVAAGVIGSITFPGCNIMIRRAQKRSSVPRPTLGQQAIGDRRYKLGLGADCQVCDSHSHRQPQINSSSSRQKSASDYAKIPISTAARNLATSLP